MTTKKVQKGGTKGKAAGKARRQSVKTRARAIIADAQGYDEETRHAIKNSLDEGASDLAELVRRAEGGDTILDVSKPLGGIPAGADTAAIEYARKAYDAALAHYYATERDPFRRSCLAVVYGEQKPGDVHMAVTLPGGLRADWVEDKDVLGWIRDAELFARTLAHPKCDDAFRKAFGVIYTEAMLDGSGVDWLAPEVLRVMFPLLMLSGSGSNHVCDDSKARDILILLCSELVNDETQREARAPLGLQ